MTQRILVAYTSKHGATKEIAERIAATLAGSGLEVVAQPAQEAADVAAYDAVVIGGAAYYGSWLKEATAFVRQHEAILAERPVWLFSSGPLGTETTDAKGQDILTAAEPKEFAEFKEAIAPRDLHVFFGRLDPHALGFAERLVRSLPAGRGLLPEGDFRDWAAIDSWAKEIAEELARASVAGR